MSDAQHHRARGHIDTDLVTRTHNHKDKLIYKAIIQPAPEAQEQMKLWFIEYMTILHSEDLTVLEALHCVDVAAVLTPDVDVLSICVFCVLLFCIPAPQLICPARPDSRFH